MAGPRVGHELAERRRALPELTLPIQPSAFLRASAESAYPRRAMRKVRIAGYAYLFEGIAARPSWPPIAA
jgi:hypothetical protein